MDWLKQRYQPTLTNEIEQLIQTHENNIAHTNIPEIVVPPAITTTEIASKSQNKLPSTPKKKIMITKKRRKRSKQELDEDSFDFDIELDKFKTVDKNVTHGKDTSQILPLNLNSHANNDSIFPSLDFEDNFQPKNVSILQPVWQNVEQDLDEFNDIDMTDFARPKPNTNIARARALKRKHEENAIRNSAAKNKFKHTRLNTKIVVSDIVDSALPRILQNAEISGLIEKEQRNQAKLIQLVRNCFTKIDELETKMARYFAVLNKNMEHRINKLTTMDKKKQSYPTRPSKRTRRNNYDFDFDDDFC